jgi:phosphohistidine phosphatase
MSTQLWLLRHAEAEPHGARADAERRLTARGEAQARAAGEAFAALELTFQLVCTSPRVRARDTARLVCETLGGEPVEEQVLSSGFDARDARDLAAAAGPDSRVLAVGHNPDLSQVIHDLTGARVELRKCGVAGMRFHGTRAELLVLMRPRELERLR